MLDNPSDKVDRQLRDLELVTDEDERLIIPGEEELGSRLMDVPVLPARSAIGWVVDKDVPFFHAKDIRWLVDNGPWTFDNNLLMLHELK
ncbi:hypothetical protein LINPERHAP1_LOCUS38837 [Linum perenne]